MTQPVTTVTANRVTLDDKYIDITYDQGKWIFYVHPIASANYSRYGNDTALGKFNGYASFDSLDKATAAAGQVLLALALYDNNVRAEEQHLAETLNSILPAAPAAPKLTP